MEILVTFIVLSIVNVVLSTIRSIVTIKCGKTIASIINAAYFAFYNVMLIYTVADFPLWEKCVVTFFCNLIGVYVVKWAEEIGRKDKLWKVEATVTNNGCAVCFYDDDLYKELSYYNLSFSCIDTADDKYRIYNIFCKNQHQSLRAKEILTKYNAKYFVSESKTL